VERKNQSMPNVSTSSWYSLEFDIRTSFYGYYIIDGVSETHVLLFSLST